MRNHNLIKLQPDFSQKRKKLNSEKLGRKNIINSKAISQEKEGNKVLGQKETQCY